MDITYSFSERSGALRKVDMLLDWAAIVQVETGLSPEEQKLCAFLQSQRASLVKELTSSSSQHSNPAL